MKSPLRVSLELIAIVAIASIVAMFLRPDKLKQQWIQSKINDVEDIPAKLYQGYRPEKAYQGVTVVPQAGSAQVLLVDMQGKTLRTWDFDAQRVRLLPNCNLLVLHGSKWGQTQPKWEKLKMNVREYDWDGNVVWEYIAPNTVHHDVHRLPNGNTVFPYRRAVPAAARARSSDPTRRVAKIRTDGILEVNPKGEVVWKWHYWDHFKVEKCGYRDCGPLDETYAKGKKFVDWTHTNTVSPLPENKWYDAGDERFRPGNYLIMPRNWSTAYIIDRKSGDIVWTYRGTYKGGLSGGHEVHMIAPDLPGAGNILIFDNGREDREGASYALEINPQTKEVEWVYDAGTHFFSHAAGALQRLPNGNTLVSEDVPARVFEVTPDQEVVWEYKSTVRTARAKRYGYNYCPQLAQYDPERQTQ